MKIDGRKARWYDCDWNNKSNTPKGCGVCKVCNYLDWMDRAKSIGGVEKHIEYSKNIEAYLSIPQENIKARNEWIVNKLAELKEVEG